MTANRANRQLERIPRRHNRPARLAALLTSCCVATLIGIADGQVLEPGIGRFGSVARSLSETEITRIGDLANAAGKSPWLVLGFPSMIRGVATLTVYLQPDVTTARLRRGRLLRLLADESPVVSKRSEWQVKERASYAYVPMAGSPGEIAGEQDLGWPFAVDGEIDDDTLISLVTFVRSTPALPDIREGQAPRVVPRAPLSAVWRRDEQFLVALRLRGDSEVFGVTVIKKDGEWMVAKWNWSIA